MNHYAKKACLLLVILSMFMLKPAIAQEAELTGEIVYSSAGNIFTMELASGLVQQLTQDGTSTYPRWSPDGETIAYVSDGDIYLMDADGSNQRNLTNHPGLDFLPVWSPDGKQIAFLSGRDENPASHNYNIKMTLYVMDLAGENVRHLAEDLVIWGDFLAAHGIPMSWSPDNLKLALSGTCLQDDCWTPQIYTVDVATGQTEELVVATNFLPIGFEPVWSLDGQFLAFQGHGELGVPSSLAVVHLGGNFAYSQRPEGYPSYSIGWWEDFYVDTEIISGQAEQETIIMTIIDLKQQTALDSQFVFRRDSNLVDVSLKDRRTGIELSPQVSPDGRWRVESQFNQEGWDIILIDVATNETRFLVAGIHPSWRPHPALEDN